MSVSIILELYVLYKAVKELRSKALDKNLSVFKMLKTSTDGPLIAIVVEDFAATLGLGIALFGSIFANITGNPIYDAISSIMIGILLMVSGLFLGYEMKHLITGETINQQTKDGLTELIKKTDSIKSIESLRIVSIGANSYLALCKVDYVDTTSDIEMIDVNNKIRDEISKNFKEITEIYFNPA